MDEDEVIDEETELALEESQKEDPVPETQMEENGSGTGKQEESK
jgi:hypothetical protein